MSPWSTPGYRPPRKMSEVRYKLRKSEDEIAFLARDLNTCLVTIRPTFHILRYIGHSVQESSTYSRLPYVERDIFTVPASTDR